MRLLKSAKAPDEKAVAIILEIGRGREEDFYSLQLGTFASSIYPNGSAGISHDILRSEANTVRALRSTNSMFREAAAFELGDRNREGWNRHRPPGLPKLSEESILALRGSLGDDVEKVRLNAAETLVKLEVKERDDIIAALAGLLDSTNSWIQLRAIDVLDKAGKRSGSALPKLKDLATNEVGFISVWAIRTIREIESAAGQ